MRDTLQTPHQGAIQRRAEQSHHGWRRFAVLDDHIGLQFADVVDGTAADVVRLQAVDRQGDAAATVTLDQPRQPHTVVIELALDICLVQSLFAQQVLLRRFEQAQHMHTGTTDMRQAVALRSAAECGSTSVSSTNSCRY